MRSTPLVSIVIPCFNAAAFVADAIRSSLEQTHRNTEVIVIDDGSTDRSVDVLHSFGSTVRWETGVNRGACAARNRGMQLATGELIQFLDADDWIYPEKLERQVAAFTRSPRATPVCDGEVFEAGEVVQRYIAPHSCHDAFRLLLTGPLPTPAPLHRREDLRRVGGFREGLPCCQERDLHLRLACHGWSLNRISEPLYGVRRVPQSLSSCLEKVLDQHWPIAQMLRQILQLRSAWTDERAHDLAAFLTRDARHFARLGRTEKAEHYFLAARDLHPSGGWDTAYGKVTRVLASVIGPVRLEQWLLPWRQSSFKRSI